MTTPNWSAAFNSTLNDGGARAQSAQINQFLGVHAASMIYTGTSILTPAGTGVSPWALQLSTKDVDQPFTMSGTSIGRVALPLLPVGAGADLLVSLCSDSSGSPGTVLKQTRVPKEWIYQLSSVASASTDQSQAPLLELTGNPLATALFNALLVGQATQVSWPTPAASGAANTIIPAIALQGNYLVLAGGINNSNSNLQAGVYSIQWNGAQMLNGAIPQPSMPVAQAYGALAVTPDTIAYIAGGRSSFVQDVYTASWDPATGTVGAWSSQTPFPYLTDGGGVAVNGDTIYVVGGGFGGDSTAAGNTVTWATVTNGQITAWNVGTPIPLNTNQANVAVVAGYLLVAGQVNPTIGSNNGFFYAKINSDGSLGTWVTGPSLPTVAYSGDSGLQIAVTAEGVMVAAKGGSNDVLALAFDANGPGLWTQQVSPNVQAGEGWGAFPTGNGVWQLFSMLHGGTTNTYYTATINQTPMISVPLPTTGLTNGTTYHILIQQQGGDAADYLRMHTDFDVFPSNPTLLTSSRNAYTWTAATPSGTAVPLQIFSNTAPVLPTLPLHTWEDNGARISTLVSATTPDGRLLGVCDAVNQGRALNRNPGFEFTISPWSTGTGTLVRSSTQAYDSNWSAQLTPDGVSANVFMQSELLPCLPGQSVTVSMWVYAVNTITSNFSGTLFWYNAAGTFISESDNLVTITAGSWVSANNTFTAPAGAYQFTINPRQSGTPPVGNVVYIDDAFAFPTFAGQQFATVAEVGWAGVFPNIVYPPTGVTQLA